MALRIVIARRLFRFYRQAGATVRNAARWAWSHSA